MVGDTLVQSLRDHDPEDPDAGMNWVVVRSDILNGQPPPIQLLFKHFIRIDPREDGLANRPVNPQTGGHVGSRWRQRLQM